MLSLPRAVHFANKQWAAARILPVAAWKASIDAPTPRIDAAPAAVSGAAPEEDDEDEDNEPPKMRCKVFMACIASSISVLSNTTFPCNMPIVQVKATDTHTHTRTRLNSLSFPSEKRTDSKVDVCF